LYYNVEMVTFWQDMFAAGTDTVSTALEWTMAELISNPKEMKRVQEVRNVISTIEKNGLPECCYQGNAQIASSSPIACPEGGDKISI
jgi:Cytochrome P450